MDTKISTAISRHIIQSLKVKADQKRSLSEKIADLRQEVDLQVDLITEEEVTKLLHMVSLLLEKHGVDMAHDEELQAMFEPTNVDKLENILEAQVFST